MNRLVSCGLALMVSGVLLGRVALGESKTYDLKGNAFSAAINPATGDVAVADAAASTVMLYKTAFFNGDANAVVGPVTVGKTPVSVAYKAFGNNAYFVVVCGADSNLYVFDASTFKLQQKVACEGADLRNAQGSRNPKDPFVYFNKGRGHDSRVCCLNLANMQVLNAGWTSTKSSMECVVSADGRWLYNRGPWSPSGFEALTRGPGKLTDPPAFRSVFYEHESCATYVPDTRGNVTANGSRLYSVDLKREVGDLKAIPVAFFHNYPVIITIPSDESWQDRRDRIRDGEEASFKLTAFSQNDFSPMGNAVLPGAVAGAATPASEGFSARTGDFLSLGWRTLFIADDAHDRLLCFRGTKAAVMPLADFGPYKEPWLACTLIAEDGVWPGRPAKLKLQTISPGAKFKLVNGPVGAALDGNAIAWTPDDAAIGPAQFDIEVSAGTKKQTQALSVDVTRPNVSLGIVPQRMEISGDGKYAVLWTNGSNANRDFSDSSAEKQDATIVLIDCEKSTILATKKLLFSVSSAAVDANGVYAVRGDFSTIYVLSLDDLKNKSTITTNTKNVQVSAIGAGGRLLVVDGVSGDENRSLSILNTKDLSAIRKFKGNWIVDPHITNSHNPDKFGLSLGPVILDLDTFAVKWLAGNPVSTGDNDDAMNRRMYEQRMRMQMRRDFYGNSAEQPGPEAWTARDAGRSLILGREPRVDNEQNTLAFALFCNFPAYCVATMNGQGKQSTATAGIWSIATKDKVADVSMAIMQRDEYGGGGNPRVLLATCGKRIYFALNDSLYFYDVPDKLVAGLAKPFMIYPGVESVVTVPADKKVTIPIKTTGTPVEFVLEQQVPGVSINGETGVIDIDGAALSAGLIKQAAEQQEVLTQEQANTIISVLTLGLKAMGIDAAGVPFPVQIGVKASDKAGAVTQASFGVIATVDKDALSKALLARAAAQQAEEKRREEEYRKRDEADRKAYEDQVKRMKERAAAPAKQPAANAGTANADLAKRIEDLEKQNAQLRNQIQELQKLLEKAPGEKGVATPKDAKPPAKPVSPRAIEPAETMPAEVEKAPEILPVPDAPPPPQEPSITVPGESLK